MSIKKFDDLRKEIEFKRGEVYTSHLNMSVGELINLYRDEEIDLEPAFQRLFRWSKSQETNFIESILLGYPIPAIFVLQTQDGVWDVIDGVQRLSTIYHFAGILKQSEKELKTPLMLGPAKILSNLQGTFYSEDQGKPFLDSATRIDFKRASIPIIILKYDSEKKSKFELFKRLNTGGSHLSPQEIRNSMILMYNEKVYEAMDNYSKKPKFKTMINLPESYVEIRQDLDILTRFIVMRKYNNIEEVSNLADINDFLDQAIESIIEDKHFNIEYELNIFDSLIDFLSKYIQEDYAFQAYNNSKQRFMNGFNWFIFETLIWGCTVLNDVTLLHEDPEYFISRIKELESIGDYKIRVEKSTFRVIERFKAAKVEAQRVFCDE